MADARRLTVVLEGDGETLAGTLRAAADQLEQVGAAAEDAGDKTEKAGKQSDEAAKRWEKAGKVIGSAFAGAVLAISGLVAVQINAADAADEMAQRMSVSTEWVTGMGYAAKISGTDVGVLERGLGTLSDRMAKAAGGSKEQQLVFQAIGVSATDTTGKLKPLEEILPQIADKFASYRDGPEEAAIATRLFGEAGKDLVPLLNEGAGGMDALRERAQELGIVIGGETASQAGQLKDTVGDLFDATNGLVLQFTAELLPALLDIVKWFGDSSAGAVSFAGAGDVVGKMLKGLITGLVITKNFVEAVGSALILMGQTVTTAFLGVIDELTNVTSGLMQANASLADLDFAGVAEAFAGTYDRMGSASSNAIAGIQADWKEHTDTVAQSTADVEAALGMYSGATREAEEAAAAAAKATGQLGTTTGKVTPPIVQSTAAINDQAKAQKEAEKRTKELTKAQEAQAKALGTLESFVSETSAELSGPMRQALEDNRRETLALEDATRILMAAGPPQLDQMQLLQQASLNLAESIRARIAAALEEENVMGRVGADLDQEIALLRMSAEARRAEVIVIQATAEAKRLLKPLSEDQIAQLRVEVTERLRLIDVLEEQARIAEGISDEMAGSVHDFALAALDDAEDIDAAWKDLGDSMLDTVKGFVANAIAEFFKLQIINPLLNSLLGTTLQVGGGGGLLGGLLGGGGAGGGNLLGGIQNLLGIGGGAAAGGNTLLGSIASMFGFGGGAASGGLLGLGGTAWSAAGGPLNGILSGGGLQAVTGNGLAGLGGNVGTYSGTAAAGGGMSAAMVGGWIVAAMAANQALFGQGWRSNGGQGSATGEALTLGAVTGLDRLLRGIGLSESTASLISGSAIHTRLFGRQAPRVTAAEERINLGEDGVSGSTRLSILRKGGLFRSDRRSTQTTGLTDEAMEAAHGMFQAVRQVMADDARAMQAEVPPMIEAAMRTVRKYDKKGKETSVQYFVDILGRTFEEESAEDGQLRIFAEARIATIDAILGTTVAAAADAAGHGVADVVGGAADAIGDALPRLGDSFDDITKSLASAQGEASAYAERWRDDVHALADGAEMLLAAAIDIRAGAGLLGEGGTLTQVADLISDMAAEGEPLAAAYARVAVSTRLLEDALELSGVSLDLSRESFVRFAADISEAAGGIERAQALWQSYFSTYYTDEERRQLAITRATARVGSEFEDIGLDPAQFSGQGGAAAFRTMFEEQLPTLSAAAIVEWLEAADALGVLIDLQGTYNELIEATVSSLPGLMQTVEEQIAEFAPPPATFAERMAALGDATERLVKEATTLGASEEQIARIRLLGQLRLGEVLEEQAAEQAAAYEAQAAAFATYREFVDGFRPDEDAGLSDFQRSLRGIGRETAAAVDRANELARAAGMAGAAEEDLAQIQMDGAVRVAEAAAALEASILSLAQQLGYFDQVTDAASALTGTEGPLQFAHWLSEQARAVAQAPQIDAARFTSAVSIGGQLRELAEFVGESTLDTMTRLRIPLDRIVQDFGVAVDQMDNPEVFDRFLQAARVLGIEAVDAAQVLGVNAGDLADATSMLNDAFERALARLPANVQATLDPLFQAYQNASTPESRESARTSLVTAIGTLPPSIRAILAPFLAEVNVSAIAEQQLSAATQSNLYLSASVDHLQAIRQSLNGNTRNAPNLAEAHKSAAESNERAILTALQRIEGSVGELTRVLAQMRQRDLVGMNFG